MVSVFLVFVAALSFSWGVLHLYQAQITAGTIKTGDLLVALLFWGIATVCFGSAAVLDGIRTATQKMFEKFDELAAKPG